jgi:transposase
MMAKTVEHLGKGGQRKAERELGWDRGTIRKGMHELISGIACIDNFSGRGRKLVEQRLPKLLDDIKAIAEPTSQADPTFRTLKIYIPFTVKAVQKRLISEKGYSQADLPCLRTLCTKVNQLNFHPQKVAKTKPIKKIRETDAIFDQVHKINAEADKTDGVLRLSCDTKARIKVGPFSRGGYSRRGTRGSDHDFDPKEIMIPFGILLPAHGESFLSFTKGPATSDFMIDSIENLWPDLKERFAPHTLVINLDNGPENSSRRTQFIKRVVDFAHSASITIRLAYYPPYHSKYNSIERLWGVLENHWNGEILDSQEKVLGFAKSMTWKGNHPVVTLVDDIYKKGIKLSKAEMVVYENKIDRLTGLEKWFVDITPNLN